MLQFTHKSGNILHYEVRNVLSADDLRAYYKEVDARYREHGKLRMLVEVKSFRGYAGLSAMRVFFRHEPDLLHKVERYAAVAEQGWFRHLINGPGKLIPWVSLRAFTQNQREEANDWLLL